MSDGMRRELMYLSSYATNRYFIPNWGIYYVNFIAFMEEPEKTWNDILAKSAAKSAATT